MTDLPQPDPRPDRCETCRFWAQKSPEMEVLCGDDPPGLLMHRSYPRAEVEEGDESRLGWVEVGECRRHSPGIVEGQVWPAGSASGGNNWPDNATRVWPITLPLDWCGEWRARDGGPTP